MPSVLVTGAARGIGKAIVDHLASSGWDVIAGVRSEEDARAITHSNPQRVSAVILDVTDADDIANLSQSLPQRLDAVVNNAGVVIAGPIETVTPEEWRKQLDINVVGALAVTQAVLPRLRESRGRVVFISSVNGRISMPMLGPYCASKFALEAAVDALRLEVKGWGIRSCWWSRRRPTPTCGAPPMTWCSRPKPRCRRSIARCTPNTSPG